MRVLFLPSSYPPVLGGVQTVVHNLARHLIGQGHEVRVVSNRYPRSLPVRELLDGVPVRRWLFLKPQAGYLRRGRPDLFLGSLYFCPTTLARLIHLMQTFGPEVVNVHYPDVQVPFVLWLHRYFDFRLVVSLHGNEIERWLPGRSHAGSERLAAVHPLRHILLRADAVTACSRHLLKRAILLEPSIARKVHVIYNGVDSKQLKNKTAHAHPQPYVLAYGRLTHQKGFDLLLRAYAQAVKKGSDVDLILAGDGEEREALEALAFRFGLDGRVHFFGRATPDEVVRLLNGCLFVVVPSRQESFGIAALEALAAGKPVLATRVGGLEELLTSFAVSQPAVRRTASVSSNPERKGNEQDSNVEVQETKSKDTSVSDTHHATLLVEPTIEGIASGLNQWFSLHDRFSIGIEPTSQHIRACYSWEKTAGEYEQILSGASDSVRGNC